MSFVLALKCLITSGVDLNNQFRAVEGEGGKAG